MKRVSLPLLLLVVVVAGAALTACKKKSPAVARAPLPPASSVTDRPPTAAPSPTLQFSASPTTITRGQQTTLSWSSTHATSLLIDPGVGNVAESGSVVVSPRESTTYTATAAGPGGEARASTRVTVVDATDRGVIGREDIRALKEAIAQGKVRPIFFAYDKAELTEESRQILQENARWFRQYPRVTIIVEGHCDERGTEEYNLALGERRAQAAKGYLVQLGVQEEQLETISYGEERPFALGQNEAAWAQNRRAHFTVKE